MDGFTGPFAHIGFGVRGIAAQVDTLPLLFINGRNGLFDRLVLVGADAEPVTVLVAEVQEFRLVPRGIGANIYFPTSLGNWASVWRRKASASLPGEAFPLRKSSWTIRPNSSQNASIGMYPRSPL